MIPPDNRSREEEYTTFVKTVQIGIFGYFSQSRISDLERVKESLRLSQNPFAGRGTPPPDPSPEWRYPRGSRFTLFAQDREQRGETSEVGVPTGG